MDRADLCCGLGHGLSPDEIVEGLARDQDVLDSAPERVGGAFEGVEGDRALAFTPLDLADAGLRPAHATGELARGHAECIADRSYPAAARRGGGRVAVSSEVPFERSPSIAFTAE
jgi:class 3 adenylate cyclase